MAKVKIDWLLRTKIVIGLIFTIAVFLIMLILGEFELISGLADGIIICIVTLFIFGGILIVLMFVAFLLKGSFIDWSEQSGGTKEVLKPYIQNNDSNYVEKTIKHIIDLIQKYRMKKVWVLYFIVITSIFGWFLIGRMGTMTPIWLSLVYTVVQGVIFLLFFKHIKDLFDGLLYGIIISGIITTIIWIMQRLHWLS